MADNIPPNNGQNATSQSMGHPLNRMVGSNELLKKFTNVGSNYQPQSQTSASTNGSSSASNQKSTSQTATSQKQISEFAKSAYETAQSDSLQPPATQKIDLEKFKGTEFIVLDGLISELNENYDKVAGTFQWRYLQDDEERCISTIRDEYVNNRVFLIVSGRLGQQVVPKVHEFAQLYCIYIYCGDVATHRKWANKFSKVRVVCNDDKTDLIPQFAVDVAQANMDWGNALLAVGKKAEAKAKFDKALKNLTQHAVRPDPNMVETAKRSLEACN